MKGKILVVLLIILTGCTPLRDGLKQDGGTGYNSGKKLTKPQSSVSLSNGGTATVLESVKTGWQKGENYRVDLNTPVNSVQNYIGDYVVFKGTNLAQVKVTGDNLPQYTLEKNESDYRFRSLFQKKFNLELTRNDGRKDITVIDNILRYDVTSNEIYENVRTAYNNKDYSNAISNIDLYFIAYNDSERTQELNVILSNIYVDTKRYTDAQKKINSLKTSQKLKESEVSAIFKNELRIKNYELNVDENYIRYANKYPGFSDEVIKYLSTKSSLTQLEYNFLISEGTKRNDENLIAIAKNKSATSSVAGSGATTNFGENSYTETRDSESKINNTPTSNQGNLSGGDLSNFEKGKNSYDAGRYEEAVVYFEKITDRSANRDVDFYIGNSKFLRENYEGAIPHFNSFVQKGADTLKKGEAMYNIAFSYEKQGNKELAETWYRKVSENYKGTIWARRASIGLIRVKKA